MIPWPIALLTLFYGVIGTASLAMLWRGGLAEPKLWSLVWVVFSGGAMLGLPLQRPWGRALAVCTSLLLLAVTLAIAGLLVASGRPVPALTAACLAGAHVAVIRYLQRPAVKSYFSQGERCEVIGERERSQ